MLSSLLLSAAAIWPSSVTNDCKPLEDSIMIGVAQNTKGAHLYCELISQSSTNSFYINYFSQDKIFAEKKITYNTNTAMPEIDQKDFRFGEIRKANVSDKTIELHYQPNKQAKMQANTISVAKVDVVDSGFDNFIRDHWAELQSGKTIPVSFASMAHLKALPLRINAKPLEKCTDKDNTEASLFCFYVEIDNAILRMLLGNIKLTYDQKHRLHEFNGVGNLLSDNQENQTVIIRYFYANDYQATDK